MATNTCHSFLYVYFKQLGFIGVSRWSEARGRDRVDDFGLSLCLALGNVILAVTMWEGRREQPLSLARLSSGSNSRRGRGLWCPTAPSPTRHGSPVGGPEGGGRGTCSPPSLCTGPQAGCLQEVGLARPLPVSFSSQPGGSRTADPGRGFGLRTGEQEWMGSTVVAALTMCATQLARLFLAASRDMGCS